MLKKYNCNSCKFYTDNLYNFKIHKKTKKHIINETRFCASKKDAPASLNDAQKMQSNTTVRLCKYCNKPISHRNNIARHYKTCIKYKEHLIKQEKDSIIQQLLDKTKKQAKLLEEKNSILKQNEKKLKKRDEELEELRNMEKEFLEFMKKVAHTGTKITNNIKQVNMYYIIQHYKKAKNYKDIMDVPLTKEETDYVHENGGVYGGYHILFKRCVYGLDIEERPFHCVDDSRNKYMVRTNDTWQIDKKGEQVLEGIYPKMLKICAPDPNISSVDELDEWKKYNDYMVELSNGGEGKILKMLNKITLLKNNVALDK